MDRVLSTAGRRQEWKWRIGASACGAMLLVIAAGSCSKLSVTSAELQASDTVRSQFGSDGILSCQSWVWSSLFITTERDTERESCSQQSMSLTEVGPLSSTVEQQDR